MADTASTIYDTFKSSVNMTAAQLNKWLRSDEAKSVGIKKHTTADKKTTADGPESVGHQSGRTIITILEKKKTDLTDDDYAHMKRVNAYIKRHLAQKPAKETIETSRWRYSLMNWGHDPLK